MFADQIEKMKSLYTDKYVLVDPARPELARFRDVVGRVKTVNMSGRALVEFDDYHLNIGWYDIDPDFLKVVDKPPPKAPKVEAKKPAAKAEAKPAAAKAALAAAPKAGKSSVADILAAARAGKAGATPAAPAKAEAAPAKPQAAAAPAKVERSKMSVADMLAAARAGGSTGAAKAPAAPKPKAEPELIEEVAEEAPTPAEESALTPATTGSIKRVDKSKMSIDDMIAYCREHDAK
jgi:hypothetical protein